MRRRRLALATLAATLVLGVLVFVCLAHGLLHEPMPGHDAAIGGVAAICLVLFTVIVPLALAAPALSRPVKRVASFSYVSGDAVAASTVAAGARDSPAWLQRFQN